MISSKFKKKGFTLIETLVAILILAIAIVGPLTIASKGLSTALVAKDQTIAYYLAQDAVEYVRFARDTNRLMGLTWLSGGGASPATVLTPCISTDGSVSCYLDSLANNPLVPTACADSACSSVPLYYDSTNGYFTYNTTGTTRTIFTRRISITTPVSGRNDEASLLVTISWSDRPGLTHTINVRENLFNWQ